MQSNSPTTNTFFEKLRPRLRAISLRIVGNEAEAEDVVQDCFFKWHASELNMLETSAAWLTTVVQNLSIDRLRKQARESIAMRSAVEITFHAPPPEPDDNLMRCAELGESLDRMFSCLLPAERLVLVLHEAMDYEHAEIAALLGKKIENTRQHLARARRRMRKDDSVKSSDEKLCRDLIARFQAALNGRDVPAMIMLLTNDQPVFIHESTQLRIRASSCANDACFKLKLAA